MRTDPTITPEEAKKVWESMENPSGQKVADAFVAAGRCCNKAQITRWKGLGWQRGRTGKRNPIPNASQDGLQKAATAMDVSAPVLTGNPATRAADISAQQAAEDIAHLDNDQLFEQFVRSIMKTGSDLMKAASAKAEVLVLAPEATGKLIESVANAANMVHGAMQQMYLRNSDNAREINPRVKPPLDSETEASIRAYRQARLEHAA